MTNSVSRNFKFYKIVIVLTCYMSLADAQCSRDTNGLYRFGSECGFICHCLNNEQCNVSTGDCPSGCDFEWVGPGCQHNAQCSLDTNGLYRFGSECGFICHCLNNEQCNVSTGECPSGCDFEWVGPGCQHNNIALQQTSRQSDNVPPPNIKYAPYANDRDLSTCCSTGDENKTGRTVNPFWRVWMPYNFTLRRMDILTLDSKRKYFDGFKVLVEYIPEADRNDQNYNPGLSQICYTHSNTSLESVTMTVNCEHAYSGNHVKIQLGRRNTQLVLCDVRIYGECAENVCTNDCNKLCFCKDVTANDKVSGTCSNGCTGRWSGKNGACDKECGNDKWGATCDTQCGFCRNNAPCDAITGKCPTGCKDGYKDTQKCDIECDDGTYGQNCQLYCTGHCKNNGPCRKTDGHCPDGCTPGYTGETCSERCSLGYYGNDCTQTCSRFCNGGLSSCSHVDGTCLYGCVSGYKGQLCNQECDIGRWGVNCANRCGMCLTGTCYHIDGICTDGTGCKAGYIFHPKCHQECEDGTFGLNCTGKCNETCVQVCDKESGTCASCKAGWKGTYCDTECDETEWGMNCNKECGKCKDGHRCNRLNGICSDGCILGYKTTLLCNDECDDGKFGDDCILYCSGNCKNNYPCKKTDGHCPNGCVRGHTGKGCRQICPIGYHGHDCKDKCSANCAGVQEDCDRVYGTCLAGCKPGWIGRMCQEETETETASLTAVVAGVGAAVIVVIIIGVLAILWYLRRTRNGSNMDRHENRIHHGTGMSNNRSEALGVTPTNNSGETYDTIQCGNADEHHYELTDLNHT